MRTLILITFLLCCTNAFSQRYYYYWIKLKDKNSLAFSVSNPSAFLSQASIERRTKQHLTVNESDLPITQLYIDSLAPHITRLVHRLKWFNMVMVEVDSTLNLSIEDAIGKFSFVDTFGSIYVTPKRATQADKFEEVFPVDQRIIYPSPYGGAYHQTNMLNTDLLHQMGFKGQNIRMAVMDNGFYKVPDIAGFDSIRPRILGTWDFADNEADVYDDGSHGTNTFSCIGANTPYKFVGTAPDAGFYLLRSEESREWLMEEYNWAAAAEWADSAGAQLFSTSLGYTIFNDNLGNHTYSDLTGNKTVITRAGNMAFSKGILVITSAGNEGASSWHYISPPADGDSIMAIGAVDSAETLAGFSGRGPTFNGRIKPDVCAQGASILALNTDGNVVYSGGTSFSCPILAGSAACLWGAFPDKTNREIFDAIVLSADRFWTPDTLYGHGIPDFYNAYLLLKTNYNDKILKMGGDITIFPNPFANDLNVSFNSENDTLHHIEIIDMQGRVVFAKDVFVRSGTFSILTFKEVENLVAGEYLVRLDANRKYSHRIIKAP